MPLLYRSLLSTSPEAVPIDIRQQLQEAFYVNAGRNLFLSRELLTLLRLLEAQGIAAIPYKGPVLATTAYGSLALRQFSDLDVLVRPQDARRARDVLLAHGYQRLDYRSTARTEPWYRLRKVYELVRADRQILVELHWAITSWTFFFPLHAARLWERLETVSLLETPVRSLAREDLLLLLCVHGAKHHWSRLGWICDVAALLQAPLDWGYTMAQAERLGGRRMLGLGLLLAQALLGTALPEHVWGRVQADPVVPWLATQVCARLFAPDSSASSAVDYPVFYLRLRERWRDKVPCSFYLAYRGLTSNRE